jgi:hypothetical protein
MRVDAALMFQARRAYRFAVMVERQKPLYVDHRFRSAVKITEKQWSRYIQTGKLKVSRKSYEIMEAMSALPINSPHFKTMVRVFEVRYNTKLP